MQLIIGDDEKGLGRWIDRSKIDKSEFTNLSVNSDLSILLGDLFGN